MGIKNLMKIIQKYAPNSIKYTKISDYKNKIIAIDGNLMLYKNIFAIRLNGYDLKNDEIVVTHLHSLLLKFQGFVRYNIIPVFVFDGMPPKIKENTMKQRTEFQNFMKMKYYKAVTQDEKKKYYFMKSDITYQEIQDCMELIRLFGYTIIESPEEADGQLANLMYHKKVDYIVTDDMDILVFGGNKILKNFTVSDKKKIQEIDLDIFKKETNLNQNQLIDLAILLGCDYCPSVSGVGTVGAYKLMLKYGSMEQIQKNENIDLAYDYKKAKNYFTNPPVTDSKNIKINKMKVDKESLIVFLKKFNYNQQYIDKILVKLDK
ncbi:FLAP endonuclease-1 [Fadolivirus algeromassiliense]|jgi:flap endonuclease-1|uniref:FLAP endonuclease-1 n=1 Tax=Fadolivirus FV1/VV64 TaxID=3070911 RepID=A0A7D3UUT7_9VIRU|nr:FLAP endonuclease-1 [Fadolivirus algeromassiliense]QKF94371.1 FLAP endonuclease-1 [Fadolivirus FV1/VV64]